MWDGAILGFKKHRDYCGNINNHVGIANMDEIFDPQTFRGILEVEFVDGDNEVYEFKIDEKVVSNAKKLADRYGEDAANRYLAYWAEEEMQRLRNQAEEDADPMFRF